MTKLTALAVAKARPGSTRREIHDRGCPGLFLVIQPTGHRSWAVRYRYRGLPRKLTLGPALVGDQAEPKRAPEIDTPLSLSAARVLCTEALRKAKSGIDPAEEKRTRKMAERAAEADTLQVVCDTFLELIEKERPMRTLDQRRSDLNLICKTLGRLPLDTITKEQFTHALDTISKTRGPVRADRCLMALKRLLKWYTGRRTGYVSVLATVGRRISIRDRARTRVLSDEELRAVWATAEKYPAPFGPFVRFLLLTATRREEAAGMRRSEMLDPTTWVIPRARYKTGEKLKGDVLIPLSNAAQAIVAAQPAGELVFPANGGRRPLNQFYRYKKAFDAASGVSGWVIHDLRRTARTLLGKLSSADVSADIAERCLGHAITGVRAHYDLHAYEDEKRDAFEKLAALIERIVHPPAEGAVADIATARAQRTNPQRG
jgi:hypothetical protein